MIKRIANKKNTVIDSVFLFVSRWEVCVIPL